MSENKREVIVCITKVGDTERAEIVGNIIRCKDCFYGKQCTLANTVICPKMNITMEPNDFCSRGITEFYASRAL